MPTARCQRSPEDAAMEVRGHDRPTREDRDRKRRNRGAQRIAYAASRLCTRLEARSDIVATGGPHVEITPLRQDDGPSAGRVRVTAGAQRRRRFDMRSPGPLRDRRRNRRYDVKRSLAGARGHAKPVRDSRLKSRHCGAKTGYARRFFGRSGESRLGRSTGPSASRVPRPCGDEPEAGYLFKAVVSRSPPVRG